MGTHDFWVLYLSLLTTMLLCRCVPLFILKGRQVSKRVSEALGLIPAAAFAALVANDLIQLDLIAAQPFRGLIPFAASVPVVIMAKKTGSLIWSAVIGMVAYAVLLWVVSAPV